MTKSKELILDTDIRIYWVLRIASALCFIGHGAFGVITKKEWLPFFSVFGIGADMAYKLMPIIGVVDISLGITTLIAPHTLITCWMIFWGIFTALLRPMSGQGWWEFFERAGNFGAPLGFLLLQYNRKIDLLRVLTLCTSLLLIGHGGYEFFMHKAQLYKNFNSIHLYLNEQTLTAVGAFEFLLGVSVLFFPLKSLFLFIFGWKIFTEIQYPIAGAPFWEFVERAGSYALPLSLYFMKEKVREQNPLEVLSKRLAPTLTNISMLILVLILSGCGASEQTISDFDGEVIDTSPVTLDTLKEGGYVVFFRHTQRDVGDAYKADLNNGKCERYSQLNSEGRKQAASIGRKFVDEGIVVDKVIASNTCRNKEMAQIAFGSFDELSKSLTSVYLDQNNPATDQGLLDLLSTVPAPGKNNVLLSHSDVLTEKRVGQNIKLEMADAAVFKPRGNKKFIFRGIITKDTWLKAKAIF